MKILLLTVFLFLHGCGGISMLSQSNVQDLYDKEYLAQINIIKDDYRLGRVDEALKKLLQIDDSSLNEVEKALRRNLIGVIYFSKANYEQSVFNFDLGLATSSQDRSLTSQLQLNLASSYYKLGFNDKAFEVAKQINSKYLSKAENIKAQKIILKLAEDSGDNKTVCVAILEVLSNLQDMSSVRNDPYFEKLTSYFFKMNDSDRLHLLEDYTEISPWAVGLMGYLEAEKQYYMGKKDKSKSLLSWVLSKFGDKREIADLVNNFSFRMDNYAKVNPNAIGLVLPLSGKNAEFGKRALKGIDTALSELNKSRSPDAPLVLHVRDSKESGVLGAERVKELIESQNVVAVIGGLFPKQASKEYIEAKKHGALFISLSPVYLPKERKDHLLLEIPGSIESQIHKIFSDSMLSHFGKKVAIMYPNSEMGEAYIEEFWRKSRQKDIQVTGVASFEVNQTDYREPVKSLLGLKFPRVRQEEFDLLTEIHSLEKTSSIRRIQTLRPNIDFDWIFIPAIPKEALQIIPSFNYFDAFNLNIIGGPSWRSNNLASESSKLGKLLFVGDSLGDEDSHFSEKFYQHNQSYPKLIEIRSFDALKIIGIILKDFSFTTRDELDVQLRMASSLSGLTGQWQMNEGIWIKQMATLLLDKGMITDVFTQKNGKDKPEQIKNAF